jgi:hypothetical protein
MSASGKGVLKVFAHLQLELAEGVVVVVLEAFLGPTADD